MKKLLIVLTLAAFVTPTMALAQVRVGRSPPPRASRASTPPVQHNLTVDEEYDLSDSQAQVQQIDATIAELSAQGQAGTLTAEGRAEWQRLYEQRMELQAKVDQLIAKRDAR